MRARMELLRHFGSSSFFQSASDRPAKFSETKSFRPRSLAHTHGIDPNFARVRNVSNDLQPVKSRNNSKQGRTTAEQTPTETTRRKSATQRQRNNGRRPSKHQQQRQPQERRPNLPAEERTEDPRQIIRQRRHAAKLPGTAAATTAATPTTYRVKSAVNTRITPAEAENIAPEARTRPAGPL